MPFNAQEYKNWLIKSENVLGRYYEKWFFDTRKSAEHLRSLGNSQEAETYDKKHEILGEVLLRRKK